MFKKGDICVFSNMATGPEILRKRLGCVIEVKNEIIVNEFKSIYEIVFDDGVKATCDRCCLAPLETTGADLRGDWVRIMDLGWKPRSPTNVEQAHYKNMWNWSR